MVVMEEVWDACDDGNANRLKELFKSLDLMPNDVQMCLEGLLFDNPHPTAGVVCVLLDNGASTEDLPTTLLRNCRSVEVFQLLAEKGMEFKSTGHEILE